MSKSATELIAHILDEMRFLESQRIAMSEDAFMHDPVRQRAFARSLEIIGEAAKLVSLEFRTSHPEIDWKGLAGLRDKLIHHYFGVDYAIVWDVVTNELPKMKKGLVPLVSSVT